jgi:hypothetical protein
MQHLREAPRPLGETAPGVPPVVAAVVMAALAKSPAGRPLSAQRFVTSLAAGAEGPGTILGRALVLCVMHFPSLLGVNVTVFGPALVACALRLSSRLLVNAGVLPSGVGAVIGLACLGVYLLSMVLLQPVAPACSCRACASCCSPRASRRARALRSGRSPRACAGRWRRRSSCSPASGASPR